MMVGVKVVVINCKLRIGRWSGLDLKDNEMERRYGGEPVKFK